ncbi:MAG: carboxymuconolactone decarboxylase family protein [Ignavibacteriae bacterium]|nr:carboxymuconolactone decarboxylase family protein [Ignavibacteriota bacterium]
MSKPPKRFRKFVDEFPAVGSAYADLGSAVHAAGPLDEKTRALAKLAISIGARLEGAVHSHVRKAIDAGATRDELRHVALLALPTIGFPSMMASISWIEDIVNEGAKKRKKK